MMEKKILMIMMFAVMATSAVGCRHAVDKAGVVGSAVDSGSIAGKAAAVDSQATDNASGDTLRIKDITGEINFGYKEANRGHDDIDIIVVHSNYHVADKQRQIYDFDVDGCISQFRQGGVSAHYMITRDGTVLKMVDEKNIAWHAGRSALPGGSRKWLNATSIGIEVISMKRDGPTEAQYHALDALIKDICKRYDIRYLTRHSDVALPLGRKDDPWGMDWKRVTDNIKAVYSDITTYGIPVVDNPEFK